MKILGLILSFLCVVAVSATAEQPAPVGTEPFVMILGIAQDGGYPQAGCRKECCRSAWEDLSKRRYASCIAIVDPAAKQRWIVDATPDFRDQLRLLDLEAPSRNKPGIDGVFLTHGHIGHYAGLVHLGREVMGTREIPVYAMPRMRQFINDNGPWDQLVRLHNISLRPVEDGVAVRLNDRLTVTPFLVPHRDEYTETVGYRIDGPGHSVLYISDIDKWYDWSVSIVEMISQVSVAYLDGTFYAEGEIPGRSMADIPHPFIMESMALFEPLPPHEKEKVRFIHLNHTNPALAPESDARRRIENSGYGIADQGEIFQL